VKGNKSKKQKSVKIADNDSAEDFDIAPEKKKKKKVSKLLRAKLSDSDDDDDDDANGDRAAGSKKKKGTKSSKNNEETGSDDDSDVVIKCVYFSASILIGSLVTFDVVLTHTIIICSLLSHKQYNSLLLVDSFNCRSMFAK